jgi:hypothetical protein
MVLGNGVGEHRWFSEPSNIKLAESLGKALGWAQEKDALYPGIWVQWQQLGGKHEFHAGAVTARKDDAPAADQAALTNVAGSTLLSAGGGLIQTTDG